jgi:hypothetical protein
MEMKDLWQVHIQLVPHTVYVVHSAITERFSGKVYIARKKVAKMR